jgi:hypothetical protein
VGLDRRAAEHDDDLVDGIPVRPIRSLSVITLSLKPLYPSLSLPLLPWWYRAIAPSNYNSRSLVV